MKSVLVAGIETVVGGNLAATLAASHSVTGISLSTPVSFSGCEIELRQPSSPDDMRQLINRIKPDRLVFCGANCNTGWEFHSQPSDADVEQATWWIDACRDAKIHLTLISSASVFTGPWMFHSENSHHFCSTHAAACVREIESRALAASPDSLVVRSHAFGWQPGGAVGWIEGLLNQLEQGGSTGLDFFRHASPILASDLAEIIAKAWDADLVGLYHIAGAERANPVRFARRLAHQFQLPIPTAIDTEFLIDRPTGFGCGETSLQTRKIRRALHLCLPMLDEGLLRLFQQHADGYRTRLTGHSPIPSTRVA